ncbi:MAG: heme-binding protein [Flammeovirgaceae bacterium]|nr:heme-binding protein [Flammeovirgaceae bacterium]
MVREDSVSSFFKSQAVLANTPIHIAEGLKIDLWASDILAPDPIAMSIDDLGNIYLTRTNRQKNSEFDIRGHEDWMTRSIALQTVEERRSLLKDIFATEKSEQNSWLKDLNSDGMHDWRDLAVERDEVWKLQDLDGDGMAEISTRVLNDFHNEITDVAGALLVRKEDMFVGIGPDMWRLKDIDQDGYYESKESINTGYAIHIGFSGHGMSGAIEGPDGKIYWGIGDIGANITDKAGKNHFYPNQGVLVRSNPDGSDFEVFAVGLRNTHEFAFDEYGNIIGQDNDGDHKGESERLVHIVEGSDTGWRSNWQYGKYTDSKNNGYNVWMDEFMFKPRWEGQAAYMLPPIMNYHNGPTGFTYNPGTGLGKKWENHFFVSEFRGYPSKSHIWGFTLKRRGFSFELESETDVMGGLLPTGIRFGPDGALYFADWINGWDTKNLGRVWRLDVSEEQNDLELVRRETQNLMKKNYNEEGEINLFELLKYPDMRIRQKAQFELVNRSKSKLLINAIAQQEHRLMRIHGIWGLGQLIAKGEDLASDLIPYLTDEDAEIIAQTAKVLGDVKFIAAGSHLIPLLFHQNPRVKFYAAQALGRIQDENGVNGLIQLLAENNDEDVYLRHAAVLALSRIGLQSPVLDLRNSQDRSLRIAAVLVLRRWSHPDLRYFLTDEDEFIVLEAARAINDDWSVLEALPDLASLLNNTQLKSEALGRRAINAASRLGTPETLAWLIKFAQSDDISLALKVEAIDALSHWAEPSLLDRVDGRYRGPQKRDLELLKDHLKPMMARMDIENEIKVKVALICMFAEVGEDSASQKILELLHNNKDAQVRATALLALGQLNYKQLDQVVIRGMTDKSSIVRTEAIGLLAQVTLDKERFDGTMKSVLEEGSISEQQKLLKVLGQLDTLVTQGLIEKLILNMHNNNLDPSLHLELTEAVAQTHSAYLRAQLAALVTDKSSDFDEIMYGGSIENGRNYFYEGSAGQCVRCHGVEKGSVGVGPNLGEIGSLLTRKQLLEALVEPSKRLAPGYGVVNLTLIGGQVVAGILMEENEEELILKTSKAEPMEIPLERIETRTNTPSSMPPMGEILTKRELRDVIAFLASLKED